jgi:hypothetical protein
MDLSDDEASHHRRRLAGDGEHQKPGTGHL